MNNKLSNSSKLSILLLSTLISGLGVSTFFIAANWFVEHVSNSSINVAILNSTCYFSVLVLLPYIGASCDRYSRRNVLLTIYIIGAILQSILCFYVHDLSNLALLVVLIAVTNVISIIRSVDQISRTAYLQSIFEPQFYQVTNRWLESIRQGITFIGGGISALLMKTPSLIDILHFNIVTFIVACILITILPQDVHANKQQNKLSYLSKLKAGYIILKSLDKYSFWVLIASITPYVIVVAINVTYPAFFNQLLVANSSQLYAALSIPYGIGALSASYMTRSSCNRFDHFFFKYSLVFAITLSCGAFSKSIYIIYFTLFVIGYCHAAIRIQRNTFIMNIVANENISKVLGFFEMFFTAGVVILSLILGIVCDFTSAKYGWVSASIVLIIVILSVYRSKPK